MPPDPRYVTADSFYAAWERLFKFFVSVGIHNRQQLEERLDQIRKSLPQKKTGEPKALPPCTRPLVRNYTPEFDNGGTIVYGKH